MKHRALEHLLSLGIGLVAIGMAAGLGFFLIAAFNGDAVQTTLPLAIDGAARHAVTMRDTGAAVGAVAGDHGTMQVTAGGALYRFGQLLDIVLSGGLLIVILYRLRRVVAAIAGGHPFEHGTVAALRMIGWALIALNLWNWVRILVLPLLLLPHLSVEGWRLAPAIARGAPGEHLMRIDAHVSIVPLLVGLVVLVLAEAFRAGQALREDNEAIV